MNIFAIFFGKNLAKYSPKRTILKIFSRGSMPQNTPNKRVATIPPLFKKYFEPPPK